MPHVKKCCVLNCDETRSERKKEVNVFKFPAHPALCAQWVAFCNNHNLEGLSVEVLSSQRYVCARHFEGAAFFSKERRRLMRGSIPTLYGGKVPPVVNHPVNLPVDHSEESDNLVIDGPMDVCDAILLETEPHEPSPSRLNVQNFSKTSHPSPVDRIADTPPKKRLSAQQLVAELGLTMPTPSAALSSVEQEEFEGLIQRIRLGIEKTPALFVPAVRAMLKNVQSHVQTDSALISALRAFGRGTRKASVLQGSGVRVQSGAQPPLVSLPNGGLGGKRKLQPEISDVVKKLMLDHDYATTFQVFL